MIPLLCQPLSAQAGRCVDFLLSPLFAFSSRLFFLKKAFSSSFKMSQKVFSSKFPNFLRLWNAGTASILLSSTKNRLLPESINASYILSRQKSTLLQMADRFYPARIFCLCPPRIHLCPIRLIRNLFKYPLIPESGGKPRQIGCPDCR